MADKISERGLKLLQYLTEGSYGSMEEREEYESFFSFLSAKTNLPVVKVKEFVVGFLKDMIPSYCEDTH